MEKGIRRARRNHEGVVWNRRNQCEHMVFNIFRATDRGKDVGECMGEVCMCIHAYISYVFSLLELGNGDISALSPPGTQILVLF